jgi:hypothetical protein
VRLYLKSFHELDELNCTEYSVPPAESSRRFTEALGFFNQFIQKSDLEAARQCIDIYESMLADFQPNVLAHGAGLATFPSESNKTERPIGIRRQHHVLIQLARTLEERYQFAGDARDLEYAARHGEEALAMCRADNTVCPTVWTFYADILRISFEATSDFEKLRTAEMLCRIAISRCAPAHPLSSTICHTLSLICAGRFRHRGDEAAINEAVSLGRMGLERQPESESRDQHRHLRCLAEVLMQQHFQGGNPDRDVILSTVSEAYRLCPPMHVDWWVVHTRMMWQLYYEYTRSGELELLNRSIELGRYALKIGNFSNLSRRSTFLVYMADSIQARYATVGDNDNDLEESVQLRRKALQINPTSDASRWVVLHGLILSLEVQFRSDGDMGHLEEASHLYHHASNIMLTGNPWRHIIISGYARSLGLQPC